MDKKILIPEDSSLKVALKKMSELGKKCLIIASEGKFIGTLSDGDIRKSLLSGKSIDSPIKGIFNENAFSVLVFGNQKSSSLNIPFRFSLHRKRSCIISPVRFEFLFSTICNLSKILIQILIRI